LRGAGGGGYYEYYKEYEDGQLKYQEKTEFNSEGYPQTYSIDNNGDGTFDETYNSEITKTVEGYLESLIWIEDGTGPDGHPKSPTHGHFKIPHLNSFKM